MIMYVCNNVCLVDGVNIDRFGKRRKNYYDNLEICLDTFRYVYSLVR